MDEHLLGYLLGALDPVTHARVKIHLESHPEARERFRLLERALAPLAEDANEPPPSGLVMATLARIAEHRCILPTAPVSPPSQAVPPTRRLFRRVDLLVAACLLVVVAGIAFPLVAKARLLQQRIACENNLRQFGLALAAYADRTDGEFPRVERDGPRAVAGIFVPLLRDAGLAQDVSVGCPAQGEQKPPMYAVADLERMHARAPEQYLRGVARDLAGNYAYSLGYKEGDSHRGLRRDSGDGLPILADRSGEAAGNSSNHRGDGQNVLYVGGNVRWTVQPTVGEEFDHIYLNHHNRVQAGVCRIDSVLGSSAARPYVGE
jgi:hypothetical protein